MLAEVGEKSIVVGGKVDVEDRYVEPTVVKGKYVVVISVSCSSSSTV